MELIRVLLPKNACQKLFLICSCIFPEGAPIDSMLYVHNGCFRICGEITVVSLVNEGPPCFFWIKCLQNALWSQFCGSAESQYKKYLTSKEVEKWEILKTTLPSTENTSTKTVIQVSSHRQIHGVKRVRIRSYSGPHFPQISPHSDWIRRDSSVSLRIQSECRKIREKCGPEYWLFTR